MKKSIPYYFLFPGIVLLLFFLMIPLCSILWPTVFPDGFSLSAYSAFLQDEYYLEILVRTIRNFYDCMYYFRDTNSLFYITLFS